LTFIKRSSTLYFMDEQKKLLLQILEITNLEPEKEAFANTFLALVNEESVYTLIQSLPNEKRDKVAKKWDANVTNPAALNSLLKHYFTAEQIAEAAEKTAHKAIYDYLSSLESMLSKEQKEKLNRLSELTPSIN
jgi:hypothetical protein